MTYAGTNSSTALLEHVVRELRAGRIDRAEARRLLGFKGAPPDEDGGQAAAQRALALATANDGGHPAGTARPRSREERTAAEALAIAERALRRWR